MSARFVIEPLARTHKRTEFACGNVRIDSYFRETVSQDVKRKYAACFVAREIATDRVAGFYTLSSSNVPLTEVPEALAKKSCRVIRRSRLCLSAGLGGIAITPGWALAKPCSSTPSRP